MTLPRPSSSRPVWILTPVDPRLSWRDPVPRDGVRPWLAAVSELLAVAAKASSRPDPTRFASVEAVGRAVLVRRALPWSGVRTGLRDSTSAAAPDVMALANDVPDPLK